MLIPADQNWVQAIIEKSAEEGWCTRINCTTCGTHELGIAIGLASLGDRRHGRPPPLSEAEAHRLVDGLREYQPAVHAPAAHDEAIRWILYEIWRIFRDRYDRELEGTYVGQVLDNMKAHYQGRLKARRRHDLRQGAKQRE